nr:hypothetical protein [uncultured Clostridium sp.]
MSQSKKNLINPDELVIAGDGTPVVSSARERKHRVCGYADWYLQL